MNKYELQNSVKSTGVCYLFYLLGLHYAYLGKWGLQLLYIFTFGGLFIWTLLDLFLIPSKVEKHNAPIFEKLSEYK